MSGIEKHWIELEREQISAHARFCSLVDNDADRWAARGLGITLGPRPVEHDRNIPAADTSEVL